jgi:N4-gp56 family major capsid protein
MPMTTSGAVGISERTNVYAAKEMLKHAEPIMILEKMGKPISMPKNKSTNAKFRRPIPFTAKTTPLTEGVTPDSTSIQFEDVSVVLKQYGDVSIITDVIEDTHEDPVLNEGAMLHGENIGRTREALTYAVLKAGTSVYYSNGATRPAVNTVLSLTRQRAVVRFLKDMKGKPIRRVIAASDKVSTSAVEAAFVAVGHTDLEADIRGLAGFVPVSKYGQMQTICDEEIGSVEGVRYVLSADLEPFADAGGLKAATLSTSGSNSDVYPILFLAQDAFGVVALKGFGSVEPSIIPAGQKTKDDPLGQRGYIGWKTWFAALRLNESWMVRLEVAVSDLL